MIRIRTRNQVAAVALLSLAAAPVVLAARALAALPRAARNPLPTMRKAAKPAALWLTAWLYKASEDHVDYVRSVHDGLYELEQQGGKDQAYFTRYRLELAAEENRERVWQQRLAQGRERIQNWR